MQLLAVNHHYFRPVGPGSGIYPISSEELDRRLDLLAPHYAFADEATLLDAIAAPESVSRPLCVITFDDGLKEQMEAVRHLGRRGIAALYFVPTAPLMDHLVLDVHKLHLIRAALSDGALWARVERFFGPSGDRVDMEAATAQYRYDADDARRLKYFLNFVLDADTREEWINATFTAEIGDEREVASRFYMDADDVRTIAAAGMLGTHAHTHAPLAQLLPDELAGEIERSVDYLEHICGRRVAGISYPYGGPAAVSQAVLDAAAATGLRYGFTMERGVNSGQELASPLRLKRIDTNDVSHYSPPRPSWAAPEQTCVLP